MCLHYDALVHRHLKRLALVHGFNTATKKCDFVFSTLCEDEKSFVLSTKGPRFNSAYSISDSLSSSIIIHVAAALMLAISLGAIFCPSNVYRENVSLSKPGILRGHNGISTARRGCSAIQAKHVCFFFSITLHNKGPHLINKERSRTLQLCIMAALTQQQQEANLGYEGLQSALHTKPGFHP